MLRGEGTRGIWPEEAFMKDRVDALPVMVQRDPYPFPGHVTPST